MTAAELKSLAAIRVTGDDAQSFLQDQLSNDVAAGCQLHAYCNPKGRALAVLRLLRDGDDFYLVVAADLAADLVARLKMFVLRAKVSVALAGDTVLLGVVDDGANGDDGDGIVSASVDGVTPRRLVIAGRAAADAFIRARGCQPDADDHRWRLADIRSGIPQVYAATAGEFIPQMINLDLVGGVSFSKGCYPGQEIVARLRHLGRVKQRMVAATVRGIERITAGDPVLTADDKKVGVVVDAVTADADGADGEHTLTATAPATLTDTDTLQLGGAPLTRIALPYTVPA